MAKPLSPTKRTDLLAAGRKTIARYGLGAPTSLIAKHANVATGTFFTYFPTKADFLNELYRELKVEMVDALLAESKAVQGTRSTIELLWNRWMAWATTTPDKPRVLEILRISEELTPESRQFGDAAMEPIFDLINAASTTGRVSPKPTDFIVSMVAAMAETTAQYMVNDQVNADSYRRAGFEALWRVITK